MGRWSYTDRGLDMKKLIGIMISMVISLGVIAAEATSNLTWEAPTTRVDGTLLTMQEIAEYRAYYEVDGIPTVASSVTVIDFASTSSEITLTLDPRPEPYVVSFAILTVDTNGRQSQLSEVVSKTFNVSSTANPGVPTTLEFTVTCADGCNIEEVTQ